MEAPSSPFRVKPDTSSDEALRHIRTANTISISPELFEKLYLTPQQAVKGYLRNTFANPTPGGLLMTLGGILEFVLGNTFAFVVFCSYGGFWFTLGSTLTPSFNAYGAYAKDPNEPWEGLTSDGFHASYGGCILRDQSCLPFQLMVVL
ncbi:MAG: hypothetical protein Q9197_004891 [Variospora fuerteventurae]